jgi:hypothetical protein
MNEKRSSLTFERFIEDAAEKVKKGKHFNGVVVFSTGEVWQNFSTSILKFNSHSNYWSADLIKTYQDDFFILQFKNLKDPRQEKFFFIKIIPNKNYYKILYVTSFEGYNGFQLFKSFMRYTKNMWLAWIGSKFLEGFDEFVKSVFPTSSTELIKFGVIFLETKSKKKKGNSLNWIHRTKEELQKFREFYYNNYNELVYIKRAKYNIIIDKKETFKISLSDRVEFSLEKGDLLEFLELLKRVVAYAQYLQNLFTRKIVIRKEKQKIRALQKPIEMFNIDKIESIKIEIHESKFGSWFKNLINTFSLGYINEYKLVSFVLEEGNPYFLAEIIDLENGSRVFISAINNLIKISPARDQTKPSTVSKLFLILQSRVNPSIGIGEKSENVTSS